MLKKALIVMVMCSLLVCYFQDCTQAEPVKVKFQLRVNLIVLKITINGVSKNFILDTGASSTVINSKTADSLHLAKVGEAEAVVFGTKILVSIVQVDSIGIDSIVLHDFTCGATNIGNVKALVGEDISGVLGFDFLSKFKTTLDYCKKLITFDRCQTDTEKTICAGDSAIVPGFGIVKRPDSSWECTTEGPIRQIKVLFSNTEVTGTVQIQDHEIRGVTSLESVIPSFELQLPGQIKNFKKLSGKTGKLGDKEDYILEYTGEEEGVVLKFRHIFINVKENLFSIICYAPVSIFPEIEPDFNKIINAIQFEE